MKKGFLVVLLVLTVGTLMTGCGNRHEHSAYEHYGDFEHMSDSLGYNYISNIEN